MANLDQTLKVLITGDAAGLSSTLNTATTRLKAFGNTAKTSFASLAKGLSLIAGGSFAGFSLGINRAVASLEELSVASKKTGLAVEDLAKLRYAAEQLDTPVESLDKALKFLNQTLGEARAGNKAAAESLAALGVSATDQLLPAMLKIADAISQIPDAQDRANKLQPIFKKGWEDVVPLLSEGGTAISRLMGELEKLGGVPTQKAADSANQLNDNLSKLATSIRGPLVLSLSEVIPSLEAFSNRLLQTGQAAGGMFSLISNFGAKLGLEAAIAKTNTEIEQLRSSLDYINQQTEKGYLKRTDDREAALAEGTAKLQTLGKILAEQEARLAKLNEKPDFTALLVPVETPPDAAATVTQGAIAASQAAQAAVPPIIVPIAIGGAGAITDYASLQEEFARQQIQGNAGGGLIRGPGTSTSDSILSWLSNKEFVVNARSTASVGADVLNFINKNGRLPSFAAGGSVGTPVHLHLGGESIGPMSAGADVAAQLKRVMRTEVLKRGRR